MSLSSKLTSRLKIIAKSAASQPDRSSLSASIGLPPTGPGSLLWNENGQLLVYIRVESTTKKNLTVLAAAGAVITHVAESYHTVTAYLNPTQLERLAELEAVESIQEVLSP